MQSAHETGISIEVGSLGTVVMIEPEGRPGLTRRVFKRASNGCYEWATLNDWRGSGERARWYGWSGKELPESMIAG